MNNKNLFFLIATIIFIISCINKQETNKFNREENTKWKNEYLKSINLEKLTTSTKQDFDTLQLFSMGIKAGLIPVWGRGLEAPGVYPDELLPSLFLRRISFTELNLQDGKFNWLFTGEQGGITIEITKNTIELVQRYYNSYGFNSFNKKGILVKRHPEKIFLSSTIKYKGLIRNISIAIHHNLEIQLFVNDSLIATQNTMLDVSRHQLRYTGVKGNIIGTILKPKGQETAIFVTDSITYQEIIGFGGITSPIAYSMLSERGKNIWWEYLKEYNLLCQREYPNGKKLKPDYSNWDKFEDASVHYYGDNFPSGEISDFSYNKKIQELGGFVIFEFWELPEWAKEKAENQSADVSPHEWRLKPLINKYVEAMVNYCITAKEKTGKAPAIVGVQNEITQEPEIWQKMIIALRHGLDSAGFRDIKIHMHNAAYLQRGIHALEAFHGNQQSWQATDYKACNLYDFQEFVFNPDAYDTIIEKWNKITQNDEIQKPFLSVEMCMNKNLLQSGSYKIAFLMSELYHKNMDLMNASFLSYCWILVNTVQPSYPASRSLFTIDEANGFIPKPSSYQLRTYGAFTRHCIAGMKRVNLSCSDKDILATAYTNKNKKTLILINRSIYPQTIIINWKNTKFITMEIADPFNQNTITTVPQNGLVKINGGQIITLFN